jgi:hypothetical protein
VRRQANAIHVAINKVPGDRQAPCHHNMPGNPALFKPKETPAQEEGKKFRLGLSKTEPHC